MMQKRKEVCYNKKSKESKYKGVNGEMAGSRYEIRDKKRKANMILNILIGIVALLILVIASQLFIGGNADKVNSSEPDNRQASSEEKKDETTSADDKETKQLDEKAVQEDANQTEIETNSEEPSEEANGENPLEGATVTEGEPGSGVEQIIENPNWKPVGTVQTGDHVTTYKKASTDWKEMEKALSYATGVPLENMVTLWIGNNGSPNDAKGTIKNKTDGKTYRVSITWIDGEGWKPTKVEVLK